MDRLSRNIRARIAPGPAALAALALAALAAPATAPAAIPEKPDQLQFPPLRYEPPKASDHRVVLSNGMVAYLVPDRTLPMVTVHVLMRVGPDLDPPGKEGLAQGMVHLLTRSGAAGRTAEQVEERVAYLGAQLESSLGQGGGGFFGGGVPIGPAESRVTLNLLSKDLDEGLALLVDCLRSPAFQADRVQLAKDQALQQMKRRNDESAGIEEREWGFLARGEGHWTNRHTTEASVNAGTAEDLRALHRRYVGPKNFILAVSGDFDRAAMKKRLEQAFAKWPHAAERPGPPPAPSEPMGSGWFMVHKDVNQGRVSIGLRGLDRYDPDFFAARLMNDVLGGGGFSSRLVNRIRSDEGLAYSVRSALEGGTYYPDPFRVTFQSKVRSVAYATQIALAEVTKMRDQPVTAGELELAKNKFVETFPAFFDSPSAVAAALAVEELTGRYQKDPAYFQTYRDKVRAVTAQDIQRVARRLLDPSKMTYLLVGNTQDMLLGDPKHKASLTALANGEPRRLPLRDPMTMKPLPIP
jgi:zinc protease